MLLLNELTLILKNLRMKKSNRHDPYSSWPRIGIYTKSRPHERNFVDAYLGQLAIDHRRPGLPYTRPDYLH